MCAFVYERMHFRGPRNLVLCSFDDLEQRDVVEDLMSVVPSVQHPFPGVVVHHGDVGVLVMEGNVRVLVG